MANFGTNLGEKFAANAVSIYFEKAVAPMITHSDWEGEIKGGGTDRLSILTLSALALQTYTPGTGLTLNTVSESEGQLVVSQQKAYYFKIDNLLKFESYVNDPASTMMVNEAGKLAEAVDAYVLSFEGDVAAGNRVGTNYTTGTVDVTVTTGAVAGTGTTFTSAMVGKGFKATGHTVWYRVKTFTSTTAIVIEDDLDDTTSAYTGGAISAGATYTIEAATPVAIAAATVYLRILDLKQRLDAAKVPKTDRWLVVNSSVASILLQATQLTRAVESDTATIRNGMIGNVAGFTVFENEQLAGDNTNGWKVLAGHKSWLALAMAFTESGIEDVPGQFAKAFKGLS